MMVPSTGSSRAQNRHETGYFSISLHNFRRALGPIVFADPAALARLNAIVWPEIARMAREKAHCLWKVPSTIKVLNLKSTRKENKWLFLTLLYFWRQAGKTFAMR